MVFGWIKKVVVCLSGVTYCLELLFILRSRERCLIKMLSRSAITIVRCSFIQNFGCFFIFFEKIIVKAYFGLFLWILERKHSSLCSFVSICWPSIIAHNLRLVIIMAYPPRKLYCFWDAFLPELRVRIFLHSLLLFFILSVSFVFMHLWRLGI